MALELRPKKPVKGKIQSWVARFQIPTGKRKENGKPLYFNWTRVLGHRGEMTKAQAEVAHNYWKSKIKGGVIIISPTLIEFAPEFIKHKKEVEGLKVWKRYTYSIKHILDFFGHYTKLDEIDTKRIDEFKAERLKSVAPGTVNRDLTCLKSMINQAAIWNQFEGDNPVSKAGMLQEIREEPIPVSFEEEDKLLPALPEPISRICEFALNTGMRVEEIIRLQPKALDLGKFPKAKIEATEQKGKKVREVPLNTRALELIEEAKTHARKFTKSPAYIFLNKFGKPYTGHDSIYPTVVRTCKKIGLRKINPHLFRHTFITRAIESGKVDPIAVQQVVGHTSLKTLLRYVHLRDSKAQVVEVILRDKNRAKSTA